MKTQKRGIILPKIQSFSVIREMKERAALAVSKMNDSRYALWLVHNATGKRDLVPGDPAKYWEALQVILDRE